MAWRRALAFLELSSTEDRASSRLCFSQDACHGLLHHEIPGEDDADTHAAVRRHDPGHPQTRAARKGSPTAAPPAEALETMNFAKYGC